MRHLGRPVIFVVDDDEAFRDSTQWLLCAAGFHTPVYATCEHFLERHEPSSGSCLILDVRMPGMSGLDLQDELIRRREYLPIIFVTGHADVPMAVRAMKRGAFDVIEKPCDGPTLITLVRQALRRAAPECHGAQRADAAERLRGLSRREHEVMRCVVQGKTNKAIAGTLGISVKTVECHRSRMMDKLHVNSIAELVGLVTVSVVPLPSAVEAEQ